MRLPRSDRRAVGIAVLLLAACALLASKVIGYGLNSLSLHPEWRSLKSEIGVMGGYDGSRKRNLLARDRLNLNTWYGFNQIETYRAFDIGEVRLRLQLAELGYLYVYLKDPANGGHVGLRLSLHPDFPSMRFVASPEGEFTQRKPLPQTLAPGVWHDLSLTREGSNLVIRLDGHGITTLPASASKRVIGFRSGEAKVFVDDVLVRDTNGTIMLESDFRIPQGHLLTATLIFVVMLLALALGVVFVRPERRRGLLHIVALTTTTAMLILGAGHAFDWYYWSSQYHYKGRTPWGRSEHNTPYQLERVRARLARFFLPLYSPAEHPELTCRVNARRLDGRLRIQITRSVRGKLDYTPIYRSDAEAVRLSRSAPAPGETTILVLGGSQTWGEGSVHWRKRLVSQVHAQLVRGPARGLPLRVLNAAGKDTGSGRLLKRLRGELNQIRPSLLVISLSKEDPKRDDFRQSLRAMLDEARAMHARVLLIAEPNAHETANQALRDNHAYMRTLARERNIPLLDLHEHMNQPGMRDRGWLWWDAAHLTELGQRLAGRAIADAIAASGILAMASRPRNPPGKDS